MTRWTQKEIEYPDFPEVWHDPMLLPDMEEAVSRIVKHVDADDKVMVYGDKDADGINAATILCKALKEIGANVEAYVPTRAEGHGVQPVHVKRFYDEGISLIVTVDNGSVAYASMDLAVELGMDMVITDHHNLSDRPVPFPVVNPKRGNAYPFPHICGAAIALKVASALFTHYGFPKDYWESYVDYASIATVADVMPLWGENRFLVKRGISKLRKRPSLGYHAVIDGTAYLDQATIDEHSFGFTFGPAINAPGRVETPDIALQLLLAEQPEDAIQRWEKVNECNERKREIMAQIESDDTIQPELYDVVWLYTDKVPEGLLGPVASRLTDIHQRPALAACPIDDPASLRMDLIKGSGRSFGGYPLYDLIARMPEEWFIARGGHDGALGFTLKAEYKALFESALELAVVEIKEQEILYGRELTHADITPAFLKTIEDGSPYGHEYPAPQFLVKGISVLRGNSYGKKYYLTGEQNGVSVKYVVDTPLKKGTVFDAIVTVERVKKSGEPRCNVVDYRLVGDSNGH